MSALLNPSAAWDALFNDLSDSEALRLLAAWTPPVDETPSAASVTDSPAVPSVQNPSTDDSANSASEQDPELAPEVAPPVGDIAKPTFPFEFFVHLGDGSGPGLDAEYIKSLSQLGPIDGPDVIGDDPPPAQVGTNAGWML